MLFCFLPDRTRPADAGSHFCRGVSAKLTKQYPDMMLIHPIGYQVEITDDPGVFVI
jgi:hypothetical protein